MRNIELETLSNKEKITLLEQLWESIDTKPLELTQAHKKELDRRLDKLERGERTK